MDKITTTPSVRTNDIQQLEFLERIIAKNPSLFIDVDIVIRDKFLSRWLGENLHVFQVFVDLCRELIAAGINKASSSLVWERMRWEHMIEDSDPDFKLNNNYKGCVARLAMAAIPELRGFFDTRSSPTR